MYSSMKLTNNTGNRDILEEEVDMAFIYCDLNLS